MLNKFLRFSVISIFFFVGIVSAQTVKAASFEFVPPTNTYPLGCRQIVNIFADATGQSSNGADLEVMFDPSQVEILDLDPNIPGIQIRSGTAYETYVFNEVDPNIGRIRMAAGSFENPLTSRELFATVDFAGRPGATVGNFTIRVNGFGPEVSLDSNIADSNTNLDLLTSTVDGSYTFETSECEDDLIPPTNTFINPIAYTVNNNYLDGVEVTVSDFGVGVDLSTVVIIINGVEYRFDSPGVTYTGDPASYTFFITLSEPYPIDEPVTGVIRSTDLAGNTSTTQIVFNIPPGAPVCPVSQPIVNINNSTNLCEFGEQNFVNNFFGEGSFIDQIFTNAGTTGIAAALLGILSLLWLLPLINAPLLLLNLLSAFLGRRTRRPWGLVLDGMSRKPISLATCRLYKSGTLFMVSQTVSDMEGRYGFSVSDGDYRLEITKDGYQKHSQEIQITKEEKGYITDVLMVPATLTENSKNSEGGIGLFFKRLGVFYKRVSPFLMFAGFILSIVTMFLFRNAFNTIIFLLYVFNYILLLIARLRRPYKSSAVIDSKTKLRIPYAIIKIFEISTMKLVDTMVSNENGEFEYFGEPGQYGILIAVRGYNFPSEAQTDLSKMDGIYSGILKVNLNRGNNKLQIFVDPVSDSSSYLEQGNLKTPFG